MPRVIHGMAANGHTAPEYWIWAGMKKRCTNKQAINYRNYGGRGISVCERWRASFRAFMDDMGPRPSLDHCIERIDNNGNYEPGNCRWATTAEQARNRRNNVFVVFEGVRMCMKDACAKAGINYETVSVRVSKYGEDPQEAFERPIVVGDQSRVRRGAR